MNFNGVLTIRTIHGAHGPFNVGRLITELGEFSVKDTLLEQYDEGRYEGNFNVTQIVPTSYFAGGRFVVEVKAVIKSLNLDGVNELKPEDKEIATEPDPADETITPALQADSSQSSDSQDEAKSNVGDQESDGSDEALFDSLWPLGTQVKLDPTVDRLKFRQQRNRLKDLGYSFDPKEQIWCNTTTVH